MFTETFRGLPSWEGAASEIRGTAANQGAVDHWAEALVCFWGRLDAALKGPLFHGCAASVVSQ